MPPSCRLAGGSLDASLGLHSKGEVELQTQVPLQLTPHALWQALAASRSPTGLLGASQPRKTADTQQGCRSLGH